ncbi:MAG: chemotaxis response regulator protein-glutamate methylesterase [Candidatus Tectomicrobia bacterium]|uniref:Protein-glutamate methylesterase/protein-glutamine glutaminase n=1 Tax=Tectimicrobiota bacterium TaxID=2528274 RepID=A0A937W1T7_UNCTE|nr:chemotaxis response regulator protein-glutamate methylesterase [Candidatus Tectomicrobia bacterium]
MRKVRVVIVDDSALVRKMLTEMLQSDPAIEVVGTASDPYIARDKIKSLNPDVLTLDVEMPRMDGLTFLRNLMRLRPMPVVMVSSLTERGADITLQALEIGAVDFVTKPKVDLAHGLQECATEIVAKIKMASTARVQTVTPPAGTAGPVAPKYTADAILQQPQGRGHFKTTDRIIALGASTGGTEAIKDVLVHLPAGTPGMVITQHIPAAFSGPFARRMDSISAMTVCEAQDGQQIVPGHVYIAPGDCHLLVARDGARYICRLNNGPPVNRHRPSVDVMFRSVAQHVGPNALGVLLTGMGDDGARGMKEMQEAGAHTLAQDEKTSVVWGMPGQAVKLGGVDDVLPLHEIAPKLLALLRS